MKIMEFCILLYINRVGRETMYSKLIIQHEITEVLVLSSYILFFNISRMVSSVHIKCGVLQCIQRKSCGVSLIYDSNSISTSSG